MQNYRLMFIVVQVIAALGGAVLVIPGCDSITHTGIIQKKIEIDTPSAEMDIRMDTLFLVRWTAEGLREAVLKLSVNNKEAFAAFDTVPSTDQQWGSYLWDVPDSFTEEAYLIIEDIDGDVADTAGPFALTNTWITVMSPNEGDVWQRDSTYSIQWTGAGLLGVNIELSTDMGLTFSVINMETVMTFEDTWGNYPYSVPVELDGLPSDKCVIKVVGYEGESPAFSGVFSIR